MKKINILNKPEIERFKSAKHTWSTLINSLNLRSDDRYNNMLPDTEMPFQNQQGKYLQLSSLIFDEVLENKGVFIVGEDNAEALSKYMLITQVANLAPIRIKRVASLLESKGSYSDVVKAKKYNSLIGTFDEIYLITRIFSNVGWERRSEMSKRREQTSFNKIVDAKSIELMKEVMLSPDNQETSTATISGLISTIQALRLKGLDDKEILNLASKYNLCSVMYGMYDEKPRAITGSQEVERILRKNNLDNIDKILNWTM